MMSFWKSVSKKKPVKFKQVQLKPLGFNFIGSRTPVRMINKQIYPTRSNAEWKLIAKNPMGDSDRDHLMNWFDCAPMNSKKQGWVHKGVQFNRKRTTKKIDTILQRVQLNKNKVLRHVDSKGNVTIVSSGVDDPQSTFLKYQQQKKAHEEFKQKQAAKHQHERDKMPVILGKDFPTQLHLSVVGPYDKGKLSIENLKKPETDKIIMRSLDKPQGGIWTSTFEKETSDWEKWASGEGIYESGPFHSTRPYRRYLIKPTKSARVLSLNSEEDVKNFVARYKVKQVSDKSKVDYDWEKFRKDYDALHMGKKIIYGKLRNPDNIPFTSYGWDSESTMWVNPAFRKIKELPSPGMSKDLDIPESEFKRYEREDIRKIVNKQGITPILKELGIKQYGDETPNLREAKKRPTAQELIEGKEHKHVPLKDAEFVTVYHGTSSKNAAQIMKEGLKTEKANKSDVPNTIFLTPNKDIAIMYASANTYNPKDSDDEKIHLVRLERPEAAVLKVKILKKDIKKSFGSTGVNKSFFGLGINTPLESVKIQTIYELPIRKDVPSKSIRILNQKGMKRLYTSSLREPAFEPGGKGGYYIIKDAISGEFIEDPTKEKNYAVKFPEAPETIEKVIPFKEQKAEMALPGRPRKAGRISNERIIELYKEGRNVKHVADIARLPLKKTKKIIIESGQKIRFRPGTDEFKTTPTSKQKELAETLKKVSLAHGQGRRFPKISEDKIVELYKKGTSISSISKVAEIYPGRIRDVLRDAGQEIRPSFKDKYKLSITEIQKSFEETRDEEKIDDLVQQSQQEQKEEKIRAEKEAKETMKESKEARKERKQYQKVLKEEEIGDVGGYAKGEEESYIVTPERQKEYEKVLEELGIEKV